MLAVLFIYIAVGPLVWVGMFAAYGTAKARMDRLKRARPLPNPPPRVSILIPAKDEVNGIERCVRGALQQDYPNFDLLVINDRSTDGTAEVLDQLAKSEPRVSVLHIETLPDGWLGKCHALERGVELVGAVERSPWILFVDSDVTLQPDALRIAISNCIERKYDALSILTRLECHTFSEKLILPLAGAAWSVMFTVARTNEDDRKTNAAANGQFFLIRRDAYTAVGGHGAVRDQITEDVELMRRLKTHDYRTRLCFGDHLAATRMHSTFKQLVHGWGRIYSGSARRHRGRIVAGMTFVIVAGFSVWPALAYGVNHSSLWTIAAIIHWVLMSMYAALIYRRTGQSVWNALLFPLGQAVLLILFGYSLRMCRTGRVFWRNTHYASWTPASHVSTRAAVIAGRSIPVPEATATGADRHIDAPNRPE